MNTSFNVGLVEVESYIISKNNICDNIFWPPLHNVLSFDGWINIQLIKFLFS